MAASSVIGDPFAGINRPPNSPPPPLGGLPPRAANSSALSIALPPSSASSIGSPVGSPGANSVASPAAQAENKTRQQIYNAALKAASNAVLAAEKAQDNASVNYKTKQGLYEAAIKALQTVTDFDQTYVMPLGFKGDKISRGSAGFGYLLKRNTKNTLKQGSKTYANFAYGFPTRYYRVYGTNTKSVQDEVDKLLAQLDRITSTKEKRNSAKVVMAEKKRLVDAADKAQKALVEQQKMNLFLAQRAQRRAGVAFIGSENNLKRRQNNAAAAEERRINQLLKNAYAEKNRSYTPEELAFLEQYDMYASFNQIPPETQRRLLNAARKTVAVRRGPRTLNKRLGSAYNRAAYAFGTRTPVEERFQTTYMGETPGRTITRRGPAPAPKPAPKPAPAPSRPGFFSRLFTRKNKGTKAAEGGLA